MARRGADGLTTLSDTESGDDVDPVLIIGTHAGDMYLIHNDAHHDPATSPEPTPMRFVPRISETPDLLGDVLRTGGELVRPGADGREVVGAVTELVGRLLEVDDCWLQAPGAFADLLVAAHGDGEEPVSLVNTASGPLAPAGVAGHGRGAAVATAHVHVGGERHLLVAWQGVVRAWTPRDRRLLERAAHELGQALEQLAGVASAEQHARARFDELRTDLLVTLDHELRTPMTILRTGLELLGDEMGDDDPERAWLLTRLDGSMDRLRGLADNVGLLASRSQAPDTSVPVVARVLPVLDDALARVRHQERGVELRLAHRDDATAAIEAQDLRILLERLLDNAVKFTGAGGSVEVSVTGADDGVEVVISDTGIGIADDEYYSVGEPFFRTEETKRLEHQGPGLGLAVVRSVLLRWRGRVALERRPEGGTVARVWLPAPGQAGASATGSNR